jgi:hypothetical protein
MFSEDATESDILAGYRKMRQPELTLRNLYHNNLSELGKNEF